MTLTPRTFLIVCPLLFLAGLVDAIGGGGGLISLPAYLLAGVPTSVFDGSIVKDLPAMQETQELRV